MLNSWGIGKSHNGWTTGGNGLPVILYVNVHVFHLTMALRDFCSENDIILVALYRNSTHILQSMDVFMFRPLKQAWKDVIHSWRMENNATRLQRKHYPLLLQKFQKFFLYC